MNLFNRIDITNTEGVVYMRRWHLLKTPWLKIYLHHILRSDEDRDLHDHPWPFVSFLLRGKYLELFPHEYEDGKCVRCKENMHSSRQQHCGRNIRFVNLRSDPAAPHRLILDNPVWSIVFGGKKTRDWGFYTKDGWMPHDKYLDYKFGPGNWIAYD